MYLDLDNEVPELPSVRLLIEKLADDLANRRSVILLLPRGVNQDWIFKNLRTKLFQRDLIYEEISLNNHEKNNNCSATIAEKLNFLNDQGYIPNNPQGLMKFSFPDVVLLKDTEFLSLQTTKQWLNFFSEWSRLNHLNADVGKNQAALGLILSGESVSCEMPGSDIYLAVRYWWGTPSLLETRLLCRSTSTYMDKQHLSLLWRECVLSSISAGDLELLSYLWNKWKMNQNGLEALILEYAESITLNRDDAQEAKEILDNEYKNVNLSLQYPPKNLIKSWGLGIVNFLPERGLSLQTMALALLDLWDEAKHRVWNGQSELLLPTIDAMRLQICNYLTRRYGQNWPTLWVYPESNDELAALQQNPSSCQWGHIAKIFSTAPKLRKTKQLANTVKYLRYIRNEIAHFRPIKEYQFSKLVNLINKIQL